MGDFMVAAPVAAELGEVRLDCALGAGCVSRFAPDGALMRRVHLPASNITNMCFGGPALDRLFVTSAKIGLATETLKAQPLAGALFEVDAGGVVGLPSLPAAPCGV